MALHIHLHQVSRDMSDVTHDAAFSAGDHPRANDGKFSAGELHAAAKHETKLADKTKADGKHNRSKLHSQAAMHYRNAAHATQSGNHSLARRHADAAYNTSNEAFGHSG